MVQFLKEDFPHFVCTLHTAHDTLCDTPHHPMAANGASYLLKYLLKVTLTFVWIIRKNTKVQTSHNRKPTQREWPPQWLHSNYAWNHSISHNSKHSLQLSDNWLECCRAVRYVTRFDAIINKSFDYLYTYIHALHAHLIAALNLSAELSRRGTKTTFALIVTS